MKIVSVVGTKAGGSKWTVAVGVLAYEVGEALARAGFVVLTGGLSGVMEEAARGAKSGGGITVGLLPQTGKQFANPYIDIIIPTGIGLARNWITALAGDVMVALPGGGGTLQEIIYTLDTGGVVVSLESGFDDFDSRIRNAENVEDLVKQVKELING